MTIDLEMAEIINVFFQESDEGLDAMESGLLSLEGGSDCEAINTIFRAAHSIKGAPAPLASARSRSSRMPSRRCSIRCATARAG